MPYGMFRRSMDTSSRSSEGAHWRRVLTRRFWVCWVPAASGTPAVDRYDHHAVRRPATFLLGRQLRRPRASTRLVSCVRRQSEAAVTVPVYVVNLTRQLDRLLRECS